jgi:hypothetical protein
LPKPPLSINASNAIKGHLSNHSVPFGFFFPGGIDGFFSRPLNENHRLAHEQKWVYIFAGPTVFSAETDDD